MNLLEERMTRAEGYACELRWEQFKDVMVWTAELVKRPKWFHFQQGTCAGVDDPGLRMRDTACYV